MNRSEKFVFDFMIAFDENGLGETESIKYMRAYEKIKELIKMISEKSSDISVISQAEKGRLLDAFIAEIRKEFSDQNWEYLDFIKDRVMASNGD